MVHSKALAVIPGFFLSSFFVMLLWGAIFPEFGIATIGYGKAMLITFALWLIVLPLTTVVSHRRY